MTDAPSIYGFSAHHDRALTLCRQSFGVCPFGCVKDGAPNCDAHVRGIANLPQCKPGRITNRPYTDFDPIQYCRYILENNPLDSRHVPYFSGEREPRGGVPPAGEVTRFQPLQGIARFYYSAAPSGCPRETGCEGKIAQSPMDIDDFSIRGRGIMVQSAHNDSSDRRAVTRKSLLTK